VQVTGAALLMAKAARGEGCARQTARLDPAGRVPAGRVAAVRAAVGERAETQPESVPHWQPVAAGWPAGPLALSALGNRTQGRWADSV
jgi:hypothetical protein